jgi:hypothetical protein
VARNAQPADAGRSLERDWWLRLVTVLATPRAVFGALLGPLVFIPLFANEEATAGGRLVAPWLVAAGFMAAGLVLILNVRPDPKHIGALLAGFLLTPFFGVGTINQSNFSLPSLLLSLLGAIILLAVVNLFRRGLAIELALHHHSRRITRRQVRQQKRHE